MVREGFKRKLTAILSADVEGYSRLMGDDEESTVRTLTAYREVLTTLIQQHNGKVLDSPGDNLLAEFASVVDAVQCAVAVQKEASTSAMSFRRESGFMEMVSTSLPGWKVWLIQKESAYPRLPSITLKANCLMDMSL
jgi:class 3 adenylate cyclase